MELSSQRIHSPRNPARFIREDPFAFSSGDFADLTLEIGELLEVDVNGIFCVGSGAIGLSFDPDKATGGTLKPFGLDSDLDLAIISSYHFDIAWRDLRNASQPTVEERNELLDKHLSLQRKRLFDGAILTDRLLPVLSFGNKWITALTRVEQTASVQLNREVSVKAWIYRDYWSLRNYVSLGLSRCQGKLR